MTALPTRSFLIALLTLSALISNIQLHAAVVARNYPMGEEDNGAAIGEQADFTADTVESDLDQVDVVVDLFGFGTYVAGRNEDSELAISFDGESDFFQSPPFDPRHFGGSFAALSQGWIKPSSEGEGLPQTVWALGTDNGGVGITEDGFWQLNSGGNAGSLVSETAVAFDEWVHLAVLRGGNNGTLYLNGSVIARNDGFWNAPGEFYLGIGPLEEDPFFGTIDDFAISGFQDGSFDPVLDIKFLDPASLTGILGDVDQDGLVSQTDYDAWSDNVGFDNGLGVGDFSTLFRGDVDQNGIVNFFDFQIIRTEAMAAGNAIGVPEPTSHLLLAIAGLALLTLRKHRRRANTAIFSTLVVATVMSTSFSNSANAQLILAEDFVYAQPTKAFGAGGGFTRQGYGGGQHTELGQWTDIWNSFGDGVITGADISGEAFAETFDPETDMFAGVTRNGLSDNWLDRDFTLTGLDEEQTLFFGITMRSTADIGGLPNSTFSINDAGGPSQIGMGFTEGGFRALLGDPEGDGDFEIIPGPEITEGLDPHRLIGKLEINASGSDERLTVWLDPTDVETAEEFAQAQSDVVGGLSDFNGNLRLDHVASLGLMFWDDLAVGTTWESVATVNIPRVDLLVDTDTRNVRWSNETGTDLDITFLQAESESGLVDRSWTSLADQGVAGFQENNPTTNRLTESNLFESLALSSGSSVPWGQIYRRGEDVVASVGTSDGLLNLANVSYGEFPAPTVSTDFDGNGATDVADIDALCSQVAAGGSGLGFDLNGDGSVNGDDVTAFLSQTGTLPGDTNLDGEVNFSDFLALSNSFGQSDVSWSSGDFDCNGMVAFSDFLSISSNFGQSATGAESVPEPNGFQLVLWSLLAATVSLRRRTRLRV